MLFCLVISPAQPAGHDSLGSRSRKTVVLGATALAAGGSLVYLQHAWYRNYSTGRFHFFNDNLEWQQVDKAGHLFSSYQLSRLMMDAFSWAGYNERQKLYIGGVTGLAYLTAVEVMDGYSRGWGFSWGDQTANLLGTALAISQEALWKEQRFMIKFSYLPSGLAKYNPSLLGDSPYTRILKDYNAQAYWLSFSPFVFSKSSRSLSWLCLSVGYGATGMVGGHDNNLTAVDDQGQEVTFSRQRLFYLSLDVDLTKIRTRSRFLNGLFSAVNIFKIPAPALMLSPKGPSFVPVR